jgi:hypothetical protein
VPNFGVDQDILDSQSHEAAAIKAIKEPYLKARSANKKPAKSQKLMLSDDPNWNSHDGYFVNHSAHEKEPDIVQYPISSEDTLDDDIKDT